MWFVIEKTIFCGFLDFEAMSLVPLCPALMALRVQAKTTAAGRETVHSEEAME